MTGAIGPLFRTLTTEVEFFRDCICTGDENRVRGRRSTEGDTKGCNHPQYQVESPPRSYTPFRNSFCLRSQKGKTRKPVELVDFHSPNPRPCADAALRMLSLADACPFSENDSSLHETYTRRPVVAVARSLCWS